MSQAELRCTHSAESKAEGDIAVAQKWPEMLVKLAIALSDILAYAGQ